MGYFKDIICTGVIRCLSKIYSPEFVGKLTGNADSASKLATARNIALTGSVTGNANFDGSGNISISTSTNHSHNYAGSSSAGGSATSAVKLATARNIAISGAVTGNANFDGSGNITISTSVNHSHNYAGSNSAGGAANSSKKLDSDSSLVYGADGLQYFNLNTATTSGAAVNACPTNDWYHILRMNHQNANGYFVDIATCFHSNAMYYRRVASGSETTWTRILDSSNYTSYCTPANIGAAPASHSHSYLPLSGGAMTGSIITPKNDNMGIIPDTNNYGQIGSSDKKFYRMYATTFYGALSGNASTASRLATARTITLSGAVTGSVSFDGSASVTLTNKVAYGTSAPSSLADGKLYCVYE